MPRQADRKITGKLPSGDPITSVVTYPETVDRARMLAMPRWRHPARSANKREIRQFRRDINQKVEIHYRPDNDTYDPLSRWFKRHDPRTVSG